MGVPASFRSVFRLRSGTDERPAVYHARKTHRKSRAGCSNCKSRKLKCDEAKPLCQRCNRANLLCSYVSPDINANSEVSSRNSGNNVSSTPISQVSSLRPDLNSLAFNCADTQLRHQLGLRELLEPDRSHFQIMLLRHFVDVTSSTIGGDLVSQAMRNTMGRKAWDQPFLMNMALAISASHLRRLEVSSSVPCLRRKYILAEAKHGQEGLRLFRTSLNETQLDFDAAVATSFLTTCFTFLLEDDVADSSDRSTPDADELSRVVNPLTARSGLLIMRSAGRVSPEDVGSSLWSTVLNASDDAQRTFSGGRPGIEGIPQALAELCELESNAEIATNAYVRILKRLSPLFYIQRCPGNGSKFLAFLGRAWPDFGPLLARHDARTLLLLAYWFTLISFLDLWWMKPTQRAQLIVSKLRSHGDLRIQALLEYPLSNGEQGLERIWQPLNVFMRGNLPDCRS